MQPMYAAHMIFATTETFASYKLSVKTQSRDWFYALMFLPEPLREPVIAIYALDIELEHVGHMVKEEMIGHIRYAWWRENVEALSNPALIRDHSVLKALANMNIKPEALLPMVNAYSDSFPDHPQGIDEIVQNTVQAYIGANNAKWEKATSIINSHRQKYGRKRESWLQIKLLSV